MRSESLRHRWRGLRYPRPARSLSQRTWRSETARKLATGHSPSIAASSEQRRRTTHRCQGNALMAAVRCLARLVLDEAEPVLELGNTEVELLEVRARDEPQLLEQAFQARAG